MTYRILFVRLHRELQAAALDASLLPLNSLGLDGP